MPKIIVNTELCTRCGRCASVCVMNIIDMTDIPSIPLEKQPMCFRCGHCEAFCPTRALILDDHPEEKIPVADGDWEIDPERLSRYAQMRRSIRQFQTRPVDRAVVERILDVVRLAPSGSNAQPVEWLVIHDTAKVRELSALAVEWMRSVQHTAHPFAAYIPGLLAAWEGGYDIITRNAPHMIFAHLPEGYPDPSTDAIIALSHFDLLAPAFGLGTLWCGFNKIAMVSYPPLVEALNLPGRIPVYALCFGYPAIQPTSTPRRNPVKVEWR
jgi:nitroreductase/ferredoxin